MSSQVDVAAARRGPDGKSILLHLHIGAQIVVYELPPMCWGLIADLAEMLAQDAENARKGR